MTALKSIVYRAGLQVNEATEDAEACTQIMPSWPKGWRRLGNCLVRKGRYSMAVAALEQVGQVYESSSASTAGVR